MPPLGPLKLNRCPERLLNLVCLSEIFQMFLVGNFNYQYILHKIYNTQSWQTMNYKKHGLCPLQSCKTLGGCTII